MSLRVKVEFLLFVAIGLIVGLSYGVQRYLVLPGLDPLEQKVAEKDMRRCVDAIEGQAVRLSQQCGAWAARPAIAEAVRTRDASLTADTLSLTVRVQEHIPLAFLVAADGDVISGQCIDLTTRRPLDVAEFPRGKWPTPHPLFELVSRNKGPVEGVMLTSAGPTIVSCHPVGGDIDSASPEGYLVVGRMMDQKLLLQVFRQTALALQVWPVTDPALPGELQSIVQEIASSHLLHVSHASQDSFRIYATYPDLFGAPALLLQSDMHRDVLAKAYNAMQHGLLAQVGIALGVLVLLLVLFRKGVMSHLSRLTAHAGAITGTDDLSRRLSLDRDDEFGQLGQAFDHMLGRLEGHLSERHAAEAALRESEERLALAMAGANDGLWDWDLRADRVFFSSRWKAMLGCENENLQDAPSEWFDRIHEEDRECVKAALDAHLAGQSAHFETEHRIRHADGSYLWVLCRGLAVLDESGAPSRVAGSQTDITPRKKIEEQLSHRAFHDALTELPNRALFLDRLGQALRYKGRHPDYNFAVLFMDLDHFKLINDGLGHLVGDSLLTAVAERLQTALRTSDTLARNDGTVARFGGDEFVILIDNLRGPIDASRVADRILGDLKEPFQLDGHEVFTSGSIGIAFSVDGHESATEFLRNADTAMYRAKGDGRSCYVVFDDQMHAQAIDRLQLETDLRRAVEREQFTVYYQPIVDLGSGKIESFEALVRWNHPERGLVPPDEFIPAAEDTGLILALGQWVLRAACRFTRACQIRHDEAARLRIGVNLSVREFTRQDVVSIVESALNETGLSPECLKLEITESAMMENMDVVSEALDKLRRLNTAICIDDFGTGYSSLSHLHRFPLDTLKIDKTFVTDLHRSPEDLQIVKTIILLAKSLDMRIVAEGIEEPEQLAILRELGCDYGQGYLFSRPVDAETATDLLCSAPTW
ncbi:MAG: EAL domain-containing protein [bacterium]|nr:EAL domain-containing protein [bacterium]